MQYRIEITRQPATGEQLGPPIDPEDWTDLLYEDDELEWDESNPPYGAVWTGPGDGTALNYDNGRVYTEAPGEYATWKMVQIADRLSAVVQGRNGERYDDNGNAYFPSGHPGATPQQPASSESWLARMLARLKRKPTTTKANPPTESSKSD